MTDAIELVAADDEMNAKINIVANDILEIFRAHKLDGNEAMAALSTVAIGIYIPRSGMTKEHYIRMFAEMMRRVEIETNG